MLEKKSSIRHRVMCLVCGKKGTVLVTKRQKVKPQGFCYFGKIQLNRHVDKYYYRIEFDKKKRKVILDKNGSMITTKIPNPDYIKGSKRKYIEYWECQKCCGCRRHK